MSAIPITFYALREAATVLGVDYCTARGLLISGQLRGFQIGRRWRVQPADIQAFIDEGKEAVQRRAATAKSIHDSIGGSTWHSESAARPGGSTSPRQVAIRLRRSAETTDRKAAQELHDKLRADLWRQAKLGDKPKYTWEDAALRWLNEQAHKASIRDDAKKIEMLTPFFRRVPLADLSWDRIQAVVEGQKGDRKPATRNRYYQLVRAILRRAMREWQWIDKVPVVRLHREPEGRVRYLSPQEIDTLLRNLPEHLRAMTRFAFATGLRRGNVLRLRWKQIDLGRRVMHVKASEVKNRKTLGIPLNDTAIAIIREQIGKHDEFVFVYQGKPLAATVNTAWRNALKKSGIEDFHFHDTRHTWASLLIQNGVPKGMIKELGGGSRTRWSSAMRIWRRSIWRRMRRCWTAC